MSRKGESITLSISEKDKAALETLALEFEMKWGDRPNISKLIEAIARHQLTIAPNHNWSQSRIQALNSARKALIDEGKENEAREIAQLLRDRSELTIPLLTEIESFLNNPQPNWRERIDNFIHRQQPFRLSYRDAADRFWQYTVLHAQIMPIEKRQYLVCRCEETEGNQEIEGLRHNWILRLDRITEAAAVSIDRSWESDLERTMVEFHLSGRLAFNYESKPEDRYVSEIEGDPPVKRVIRNIHSSFWFFRDIAQYRKDCEVISPESIRDRIRNEVKLLAQKYKLLD